MEPYEGNDSYIFISYSHKDIDKVFSIIQDLMANYCRVWYDMGIDIGTEWSETIAEHIIRCAQFIVFISKNSMMSHNVRREVSYAIELKKPMICIYIEDTELSPGMKMQLNIIQAIHEYKQSRDIFYRRLYKAILSEVRAISFTNTKSITSNTMDRYSFEKIIGRGGMGEVHIASDKHLNTLCAVKIVKRGTKSSDILGEALKNEANILTKIRHSFIPRIFDYIVQDEQTFLITDYIQGETLTSSIYKNGSFLEKDTIIIGLKLCDIVAYLHSLKNPIINGDIKPSNIIANGEDIFLVDFGTAFEKNNGDTADFFRKYRWGTPGNTSYEHESINIFPDERLDIYGIGITLVQLIVGDDNLDYTVSLSLESQVPNGHVSSGYILQCNSGRKKITEVSSEFEEILRVSTNYKPEDRYTTVNELKSALLNALKLS